MTHRILVVDDEIEVVRLLKDFLTSKDYEVYTALNGADALALVKEVKPDIVLLDLGLPDIQGIELLKRLREWSRVPVIILSVRDRELDKVAALDAGADDYVTKPFSTPELLARLRAAQRKELDGQELHLLGRPDQLFRQPSRRRLSRADRVLARGVGRSRRKDHRALRASRVRLGR